MDHNEYLKIKRRVAEHLFLQGCPTLNGDNFSGYADICINVAETFATRLRLSEAKEEDLANVYRDFDHMPPMEESPVDEEELLNYVNNIPQADENDV